MRLILTLSAAALLFTCGTRPICDASNCSSGCCDLSGICFSPSIDSCGIGGAACSTCGLGESCSAGVCRVGAGVDAGAGGGASETGGGTANTGGGSAVGGGGTATTGGGSAVVGGGTATTGGGSAVVGGGTAITGGGSAVVGGGTAITGGGSAGGGGGSASTGGGSPAVGGGTASTGGGGATGGGSAVGGGTATGGGTGLDAGCAIPQGGLRVSFPYEYQPLTVLVQVAGTCVAPGGGYKSASVTQVFTDSNPSAPVVGTSSIDFAIGQRPLSTGEQFAISTATGIPLAQVPVGTKLREAPMTPVLLVPTPPTGISVSASFGSGRTGLIRFSGSPSSLTSYVNGTLVLGVTATVAMEPELASVNPVAFDVSFSLRTSAPPYVSPVSIALQP